MVDSRERRPELPCLDQQHFTADSWLGDFVKKAAFLIWVPSTLNPGDDPSGDAGTQEPKDVSEQARQLVLPERTASRSSTGGLAEAACLVVELLAGAGRLTRSLAEAGLVMALPTDFKTSDRAHARGESTTSSGIACPKTYG